MSLYSAMAFTKKQLLALERVSGARKASLMEAFAKQLRQPQPKPIGAPKKQQNNAPKGERPTQPRALPRAGPRINPKLYRHAMSAIVRTTVPSMRHEGKAFPFHGIATSDRIYDGTGNDVNIPLGYSYLGFFTNVGMYACCGVDLVYDAAAPTGVPTIGYYNVAALAGTSLTTGPTSGRAMKHTLSLLCTTPAIDRGGRVYIANVDQRLRLPGVPFSATAPLSNAGWNVVASTIKAFPEVKKYDLVDFPHERAINSHVVNHTDYDTYTEWGGSIVAPSSNFMAHIAQWTGGSFTNDAQRPLSTVVVLIEAGKQQNISVTPRAAWYTRHALDTIPGQAMSAVPTASQEVVNAIHSVSSMGSDILHDVEAVAAEGRDAVERVAPMLEHPRPVAA